MAVGDDAVAVNKAARALREAEIEAVQSEPASSEGEQLEDMSIDELRRLAASLDVPDRARIVERDKLIEAIRAKS
jgi:hypothetical protein